MSHCKICGLWKETPNHRMNLEPVEAELAEEHRQNIRNLARAEKAEARVAELEEHLAGRDGFHEYGGECYEFVAENPPEREGDQD